jgi:putative sterol carrier protein
MFLGDKEKKMAYTYGTDEYEQAYKDEVDKRMAEEPKPYIYLTPEWVAMFEKGIQEDATYKEVGEAGDFVITGSAERWMDVGRKELDTVKGMMQGKLRLKGNLPTIVRYVKASVRLTDISADVGGRYPDELSPDEVDGLRATVKDLADRFLGITI